jgi:hypothetical protein
MTISINTIAEDDVINSHDGAVTLSGTKTGLPVGNEIELKIFNSAGTQVCSNTFSDDGTTWSRALPLLEDGAYTVSVDMRHDSVATPTTRSFTIDRTRPTLNSITVSNMDLGPGETALVTFQFSETVTGFTAQDIGAEGRDPSPAFDTTSYLSANPDVAAAHVNPLVHFLQSGHYEGRAAIADGVWG